MKQKTFYSALAVLAVMTSCQNNEHETYAKKTMEIHDEIMPEISKFDKTSIKIDSILSNLNAIKVNRPDLDTTNVRSELSALKENIEQATGLMMDWMHGYSLDSTDVDYQKSETDRVTKMKEQFGTVNTEIATKLKDF